MVKLIFLLLAFAATVEIGFGILFLQLYLQRKKLIYLYFSIFTAVAIFWSIGDGMMLFANHSNLVYLGFWQFLIAPMLSTLFILFFCQQFIKNKLQPLYALPVIGIILYAIILAFNHNLINVTFSASGLNSIQPHKVFYIFYALYFTTYFNISISTLRQHTVKRDLLKYSQAQNIVYGTGFTGTPGILTNIILPIFGVTQLVWLGPLFALVFLSFSTIAITKYRLFDIRGAILRSVGYLITIAVLAAVYSIGVVGGLSRTLLTGTKISIAGWTALSLITLVVAVTFNPIKKYFNRVSSKLFFQDSYDTQSVLDQLGALIVGTVDSRKLQKTSLTILEQALKPSYAMFLLHNGTPQLHVGNIVGQEWKPRNLDTLSAVLHSAGKTITTLEEAEDGAQKLKNTLLAEDIGLAAPLVTKDETIGYLIVGSKKSGNIYNSQDVGLLNIATNELAVALQNAQRFEEIQAFNITLQEKVNQATRELQSTNKKLVALDEAKDEFISMASHQLRTPLTSIKGYLSMLIEGDMGKVPSKQLSAIQEAFGSSQRMVFLIADFLNVSRIKTGKFVIEPKKLDLSAVVKEEIDQLTDMAKAKSIQLNYEPPHNFPIVKLDDNKMRQVMMNMMDNAIYYTPTDGSITVQLYATADDIIFKVVDTGIGVSKAEQHKLFTKFFRASNARKARPDGTGLGLFMAQKIIVAQEGSIIFESTEGKGSTFGFRFPLSKVKA